MILFLYKPFGGDNYLCLTKPEEIQKFHDNLSPGDEFLLKVIELSDQEYEGLDDFQGFDGPVEGAAAPEEVPVEEEEEVETEPAPPVEEEEEV